MTSETPHLHVSKNLNISKTKEDIEKLKTPLRLVWKCCSVVFKIGSKIFLLQWRFKQKPRNNLPAAGGEPIQVPHHLRHVDERRAIGSFFHERARRKATHKNRDKKHYRQKIVNHTIPTTSISHPSKLGSSSIRNYHAKKRIFNKSRQLISTTIKCYKPNN